MECITRSPEETTSLGCEIGAKLRADSVLALFGDLAAGKTTLIKGLVEGACNLHHEMVASPTFQLLNIYTGSPHSLFHFDLYRFEKPEQFLHMGFEEYFYSGGIACIEWSERIESLLPPHAVKITLSHLEDQIRKVEIDGAAF